MSALLRAVLVAFALVGLIASAAIFADALAQGNWTRVLLGAAGATCSWYAFALLLGFNRGHLV